MRAQEFILEQSSALPEIIYHGTASANLSNIMKHGLKPRLNKWEYSNRWHGGGLRSGPNLQPGEKRSDYEQISTSTDFENAKSYAEMGGSTGAGTSSGVVVAVRPLPGDWFEVSGMPNEVLFFNSISPDRLTIVWPPRLAGKEEQLQQLGQKKKQSGAEKTQQIKQTNQQLKNSQSRYRVKSTSSTTPRIAIWFTPTNGQESRQMVNTNISDSKFQSWLAQEIKSPLNTDDYNQAQAAVIGMRQ